MKILITKDEHLRLGFRDKFRKPGWENDMINKHKFIVKFMNENNIEWKITTGDIFDKQTNWSFKQYIANKRVLEMYKNKGLKIISIAGNHDMINGRLDIKDSPFEEMVKENLIEYMNKKSIILGEAEVNGIDYKFINDDYTKKDFLNEIKNLVYLTENQTRILVIHQNITPDNTRVTEFTYDEISKVCKEKNIKAVICGHYHIGYPTMMYNEILFINPWNLWRVVRDYETEYNEHVPEFVVLDTNTLEFEHFQVPHKSYTDTFDLKEIEIFNEIKNEVFSFFKNINLDNVNEDENDIKIVEKLLNDLNIDKKYLNRLLEILKFEFLNQE